jgi:hypothetical protein
MTQKYYTDCLLPVDINAVNTLQIQEPDLSYSWLLQEDRESPEVQTTGVVMEYEYQEIVANMEVSMYRS